jgi:hypothetical protein
VCARVPQRLGGAALGGARGDVGGTAEHEEKVREAVEVADDLGDAVVGDTVVGGRDRATLGAAAEFG